MADHTADTTADHSSTAPGTQGTQMYLALVDHLSQVRARRDAALAAWAALGADAGAATLEAARLAHDRHRAVCEGAAGAVDAAAEVLGAGGTATLPDP